MKILIGLGNPGIRYRATRHNAGFLALDLFAQKHRCRRYRRQYRSLVTDLVLDGEQVMLLKPQTFMNRSGEAVRAACTDRGCTTDELLVVCDDVELSPGTVRVRARGRSGGQRGLDSIIAALGTDHFARVRIGVGRPVDRQADLAVYVLQPVPRDERALIHAGLERALTGLDLWITQGVPAAMNAINGVSRA